MILLGKAICLSVDELTKYLMFAKKNQIVAYHSKKCPKDTSKSPEEICKHYAEEIVEAFQAYMNRFDLTKIINECTVLRCNSISSVEATYLIEHEVRLYYIEYENAIKFYPTLNVLIKPKYPLLNQNITSEQEEHEYCTRAVQLVGANTTSNIASSFLSIAIGPNYSNPTIYILKALFQKLEAQNWQK